MKSIVKYHPLYKYRILYNGYNLVNELSYGAHFYSSPVNIFDKSKVYYDEYYGRFFTGDCLNQATMVYGGFLGYYDHGAKTDLQIVDHLHVPYRLVPIFKANNLQEIIVAVEQMKKYSPDHTFLFRGQEKIYTIERSKEERDWLFGVFLPVKEPSFLPSYIRQKQDHDKVVSAWHNVCSLLIAELMKSHKDLPSDFRRTEMFHLLALGLAQHYGLPSVGLDLTDNIKVALWFAINKATYSNNEHVKAELLDINEGGEPTIFVFRCRQRSIYRYSDLINGIGAHRPEAQNAYFNYCGWGVAKNQMALDLACAFRVDPSFENELPINYTDYLFPKEEDDEVLRIFLKIKDLYDGTELGNMLKKIYI